jgi:glutamate/tyrosine decarboxylase-like PLP-dependent enzyme
LLAAAIHAIPVTTMSAKPTNASLDPADWTALRALAHRAVDDALDYLATQRDRPVWQPTPEPVIEKLRTPMPREPQGAEQAYADFREWVMPYQMGNTHPRFWSWYMGGGTAFGAVGDFLAATMNPNMGGGNHVANHVEAQVLDWCKEMVGLPHDASGLLVSGASMANFVGLAVARNAAVAGDVRSEGVGALVGRAVFYASSEVHSCVQKALELLGLGSRALRKVAVDAAYRMDLSDLERAISADRAAGLMPCCVIGTAATINTGSVDDLDGIAAICRRESLWFHVDGAIGAVLTLSRRHRALVAGMEHADSVALDLHKWLQVPFEAGCALVRDRHRHRGTFALTPEYLEKTERGIASGPLWFSEYGLQLSRGFRALKVWLSFKELGADRYGQLIDASIEQAKRLAELVEAAPGLELLAPVVVNIVCFRYNPGGRSTEALNALNEELLIRLHESGIAAPSYTTLDGRYCLRAALANHRTTMDDLPVAIDAIVRIGRALASGR